MKPQVDENEDNKSRILVEESLFVSLLKDEREDTFIILKFRNTFAISQVYIFQSSSSSFATLVELRMMKYSSCIRNFMSIYDILFPLLFETSFVKLYPSCFLNVHGILMECIMLKRKYNFDLGVWEVLFIYKFRLQWNVYYYLRFEH